MIKIEIITIGDELLIGQIVDSNSTWIAQQCSNIIGIKPSWFSTVGDNYDDITNAIQLAYKRADVIFISGGLGPTNDDITKTTLCKFFNSQLVVDNDVYQDIETLFKNRGFAMTPLNASQVCYLKTQTKC